MFCVNKTASQMELPLPIPFSNLTLPHWCVPPFKLCYNGLVEVYWKKNPKVSDLGPYEWKTEKIFEDLYFAHLNNNIAESSKDLYKTAKDVESLKNPNLQTP